MDFTPDTGGVIVPGKNCKYQIRFKSTEIQSTTNINMIKVYKQDLHGSGQAFCHLGVPSLQREPLHSFLPSQQIESQK